MTAKRDVAVTSLRCHRAFGTGALSTVVTVNASPHRTSFLPGAGGREAALPCLGRQSEQGARAGAAATPSRRWPITGDNSQLLGGFWAESAQKERRLVNIGGQERRLDVAHST